MSEEKKEKNSLSVQLAPFLIVLLVIVAFFAGGLWTKLKSSEKSVKGTQTQATDQTVNQPAETAAPTGLTADGTDGSFSYSNSLQNCTQDGKPVVYLFSTTGCPHCVWVKDTFDKVAKEYIDAGKIVAYHWEYDTGDNTLTSEVEKQMPTEMQTLGETYGQGYVPTFVIGCKYWRVGNAYESQSDLASEETEFRRIFDKVIASQ